MKPKTNKRRQVTPGGRYVDMVSAEDAIQRDSEDVFNDDSLDAASNDLFQSIYAGNSDSTFEDFNIEPNSETSGADEELRMEALRQAVNIAKLMTGITVHDVLAIAQTVYDYLNPNHF